MARKNYKTRSRRERVIRKDKLEEALWFTGMVIRAERTRKKRLRAFERIIAKRRQALRLECSVVQRKDSGYPPRNVMLQGIWDEFLRHKPSDRQRVFGTSDRNEFLDSLARLGAKAPESRIWKLFAKAVRSGLKRS